MSKQSTTRQCRRCGGRGSFRVYNHIRAGVCFRCEGSGVELTAAEIRRRRSARAHSAAVKAIEIAEADIAHWSAMLDRSKAQAIEVADRMVARGQAVGRAEAFQAMIDRGSVFVRRVRSARECLTVNRARLADHRRRLARLSAA